MAHVRTQIRNAVATRLTGLSRTGAQVYRNRMRPLPSGTAYALIVRTDDENVDPISLGFPALEDRRLDLTVECLVQVGGEIDSELDAVIAEVEAALGASEAATTLDGLVKSLRLRAIAIDFNAESDIPTARALMRYEANYFTTENAPEAAT